MTEQFQRLLSKLSAHGSMLTMQRGGKAAVAHCPAHEDNKQSLSLKLGDDGKVLVHCFAGCETEAVVERLGLTMNDLFADSPARQAQASEVKIVATYDYRDEKGELLNQVVRLEPKSFRQRRPDGKGGWVWTLGDVRRVLYRLPEMNRDRKQPLWIVEGEKDADALAALGFRVTTTLGGASAWKPEYVDSIKRCKVEGVYVVPDNDAPGRKYAHAIATSLHEAGIQVKIVNLPGVPEKGDVSDWLKTAQYPAGDLRRLAQAAPLFTGQEAPPVDPTKASRPRAARLRRPADLDPTKTSFLIDGLIPLGWFGEIAGRDGRGKTLLAMNIAKSVLTGEKLFNTFAVNKTGPVVMYMLDDPENLVRERIEQLGLISHPDLHVGTENDLDKNDPHLFEDLTELCLEVKPVLVIVDALYLFTPENKKGNDSDQANSSGAMGPIVAAFNRICSETGATIALVAHDNKAGSDVAGSQVIRNMAKWILRMALPKQYEKDKQGGRTTNDRILELDKLKVSSSKVWGMTITTSEKHGGAEFEIVPLDHVEKKSKAGKTVEEMAERRTHVVDWLRFFLEPGARTTTEVMEAALEAKIKKKELEDKGMLELAGVEKSHPHPDGPWVWKLKSS